MAVRIVLADDSQQYRSVVRALLEKQPGIQVVAGVANGNDAMTAALQWNPEVIIMDVTMPRLDGIEATRRILVQQPDARVLALSSHREARFVTAMLDAGARGYVLKEDEFAELLQAIREVVAGRTYLSPAVRPTRDSSKPAADEAP